MLLVIGLLGAAIRLATAQDATTKAAAPAKPPAKAPAKPAPAAQAPAAAPSAPAAPAVMYKSLPVDDSQKKRRSDIGKILRAGTFQAGEDTAFDVYHTTYAFARWTQPENYASIPEYRRELFRSEFAAARSGPVYDRLVSLTMDFMTKVVNDPGYHPVVRVNAMLAIGELDVSIPTPGSRDLPQPLPAALDFILTVLKDPNQIDAVRIAALQGLVRHASLPMANAQTRDQQVIPLLVQLASTKDPPPGRTKPGHAWMRALAIEALGALRLPGTNGQTVKLLVGIVGETDTPLSTRLAAVRALGRIDYKGLTAVKPDEVVVPVAQFLHDATTAEANRPINAPASGGTSPGMPGMPGGYPGGMSPDMPSGYPGMMPGSPSGYGYSSKGKASRKTAGGGGSGYPTMPGGSPSMPGGYPAMPGGYPGMPGYPGMGPGGPGADEADDRSVIFRRRLKTVLGAVQFALVGQDRNSALKAWTSNTPDQALVQLVEKYVNDHIKVLDSEEDGLDTLKKNLAIHRKTLKAFLDDPAKAVKAYQDELAAKAKPKK
ncbi:MAG: HEAT repeat domain-containing protein [Thermoguttaceae bacterium]|nr:HEAT repeat domain-containing protein [Thermoguttaceae bacterium]